MPSPLLVGSRPVFKHAPIENDNYPAFSKGNGVSEITPPSRLHALARAVTPPR